MTRFEKFTDGELNAIGGALHYCIAGTVEDKCSPEDLAVLNAAKVVVAEILGEWVIRKVMPLNEELQKLMENHSGTAQ